MKYEVFSLYSAVLFIKADLGFLNSDTLFLNSDVIRIKDDAICRSPHVSKGLTSNFRVKPLLTRGLLQLLNYRRHDLSDTSLQFAVVGYGGADGDFGGGDGGDALGDHLGGVDEEAGRDAFFEAVAAEVADLLADLDEVGGDVDVDAAFFRDDLGFGLGVWDSRIPSRRNAGVWIV